MATGRVVSARAGNLATMPGDGAEEERSAISALVSMDPTAAAAAAGAAARDGGADEAAAGAAAQTGGIKRPRDRTVEHLLKAQKRRDANIFANVMHEHHETGVAIWKNSHDGVWRACGDVRTRDVVIDSWITALREAQEQEKTRPAFSHFQNPEDAFHAGTRGAMTARVLIKLVRMLRSASDMRRPYAAGNVPEHMKKYLGRWMRCKRPPAAKGRGWKGWGNVAKEDDEMWRKDVRSLLLMDSWKEGPSEPEGDTDENGRQLLTFDAPFTNDRKFSEYTVNESLLYIATWLEWCALL